ncbi:hypothetical protein GQ53DRAFT_836840 [Thozetella sp. PMI_491]|nr:hypothetical protein GQ53DRAFT_836840 [Thozetella sp. PMI_491]
MDSNIIWKEDDLNQEWLESKYKWFNWNTPIHLSLFLEDYASAEVLLRHGTNINLCNAVGRTPLMEAVRNHKIATVAFLIAHAADLDAPTVDGTLQKAGIWHLDWPVEAGITPLFEAMRFADARLVRMLVDGGADVNRASQHGWMPLDLALLDKQVQAMDILLEQGGRFSEVPDPSPQFRDVFCAMALGLFAASTSEELLPPSNLQEVYRRAISASGVWDTLLAPDLDKSALSSRLIKLFSDLLCKTAGISDLQTTKKPFCSPCLAFQAWAAPTYEVRCEDYGKLKYGTKEVFELYLKRDLLRDSASAGCPLCRLIADSHDKTEAYRRRWIEDTPGTMQEFDAEMAGPIRLEWERPAASYLFLRVYVGSSFEFVIRLTHLDQDTIINTCHYNDEGGQTDSPEAFKLAKYWVKRCESSHKTCQKFSSEETSLPTRVVDVSSETRDPFLVESHGLYGRFCALSYCWGEATSPSGFYRTTKSNLSSHQRGMPLLDLPSTLRESIIVARNLGFRYIWIDALCIIQDDGEDWARETARMQLIYAGASLTISTLTSKSSEDGLFTNRRSRISTAVCLNYRVPKAFREYAQQSGTASRPLPGSVPIYLVACPYVLPAMEPALSGTVHRRAWTLQEQMMSTRILYYGLGCLWWECFELQGSESCPGPLTISDAVSWERSETKNAVRGLLTEPWSPADVFKSWQDLLSDYTSRSLTNQRDRLTAILGLGKIMEPYMKSEFVAGVWSGNWLLKSLCWEVIGSQEATRNPQFPSWSWASVTAHINFDLAGYRKAYGAMRHVAEVVAFEATAVDEAQTAVKGSVTLRGRFGKFTVHANWETRDIFLNTYRLDCDADPVDQCWFLDVLESDAWTPARKVRLVLRGDNSGAKTFRRIGIGLGNDEGCSDVREDEMVVIV